MRRRMASWLSAGWCFFEGGLDWFLEVVGDGTLCRPDPGAILYHSSQVGAGRCSSLASQEAGVSDVCHFGRNKREQGREPDPWVGGEMYRDSIRGTILLMPLTFAVRREADPGEDSLGRAACCGFRSLHGTV